MPKCAVLVLNLRREVRRQGNLPSVGAGDAVKEAAPFCLHIRSARDLIVNLRRRKQVLRRLASGSDAVAVNDATTADQLATRFQTTERRAGRNTSEIREVVVFGAMGRIVAKVPTTENRLGYRTLIIHEACPPRAVALDGTTGSAAQVRTAMQAARAFFHGKSAACDPFITY